jgi:glycosyltransferase 2 family protein
MTGPGDPEGSGFSPPTRLRIPTLVRAAISAGLLLFLLSALGIREVAARLAALHPGWVALAVGISVAQILLLGWRWQVTARALGVPIRFRTAVVEYHLGIFLNQVLPGGILGDLARAWRQSRSETHPLPRGATLRAVLLERASAQVVMTGIAIGCTILLFARLGTRVEGWAPSLSPLSLGLTVVLGAAAIWGLLRWRRSIPARGSLAARMWTEVWNDARRALLSRSGLPFHLLTSVLVVASYVAVFVAAARAVGVQTAIGQLALLVPPVLMTMLIPVTISGWGLREGAAAALWEAVGLSPADGILISVVYGLLVLLSSLPGGWVLLKVPLPEGRRDRTRRPPREKRSDRPDEAPPPASESGGG